jgi:hypothetical protein
VGTFNVSAVIDMDDPLAAAPPRDTPPSRDGESSQSMGREPGNAPPAEKQRRGRKPGDAQLKADLKEIEEKLTQLLTLPSVPMDAAGDDWPARHIEDRAPALAHAITETARNNIQLREKLLQLLRVGDGAGLVIAAFAYAAPVALYYGVIPVPPPIRAQLPVPRREEARGESIIDKMRAEEERLKMQNIQRVRDEYDGDHGRTPKDSPPAPAEPAAAPFAAGTPPAL